jgi:dehydrogenase/reductase SDR family member 4
MPLDAPGIRAGEENIEWMKLAYNEDPAVLAKTVLSDNGRTRGFKLMLLSLSGKIALVTGGTRGIGKASAIGFAKAGADVVVVSRKLTDLEEVAAEIKNLGHKCLPISAHLGRLEDIKNVVTAVKKEFGRIDILVNNAATNPTMASAMEIGEKAWDAIMNLNLKGAFFLAQNVATVMMEKGGGSIINVSSCAGIRPDPALPVYSISKAGVIMATRVMAKEWGKYNIRVNAIAPGLFKTRFSEALWNDEKILRRFLDGNPLGRIGEPEEIVGTMIYLASDAASYVTGAVISVDGGLTI